jgi:hypothetical protein
MPHMVIAPLIFGAVVTVAGLLVLVFNRAFRRRFPNHVSSWDWRDIVPDTWAGTLVFGAVVLVAGILISLRGGLRLF